MTKQLEIQKGYLYVAWNITYGKNVYRLGESENTKNRSYNYNTYYIEPVKIVYKSKLVNDKITTESIWFSLLESYRIKNSFFRCDLKIIVEKAEEAVKIMNTHRIKTVLSRILFLDNYRENDNGNRIENTDIVSEDNDKSTSNDVNKNNIGENINNENIINHNKEDIEKDATSSDEDNNDYTTSNLFLCKFCDKPFKYRSGLYRHQNHRCKLKP